MRPSFFTSMSTSSLRRARSWRLRGLEPAQLAHPASAERAGRGRRDLVLVDEIGWREDEHLAHHVWVLLVAAHEADQPPAGRVLDNRLKAFTHQLLKLHPLLDYRRAASSLQHRLFTREKPPRSTQTTRSSSK
jgi:hypothetical protein